jgi:hypothetical protein
LWGRILGQVLIKNTIEAGANGMVSGKKLKKLQKLQNKL